MPRLACQATIASKTFITCTYNILGVISGGRNTVIAKEEDSLPLLRNGS